MNNQNDGSYNNSFSNFNKKEDQEEFLSEFDFGKLLIIINQSLLWVLFIFTFSILGSWLYYRYTKPVYQSSSILKLDIQSQANVLGLVNPDMDKSSSRHLSGEIEIIKSPLIYHQMVNDKDLKVSYYLHGKVLTEERYKCAPVKVDFLIFNPAFYNIPFNIKLKNSEEFDLHFSDEDQPQPKKLNEWITNENYQIKVSLTPSYGVPLDNSNEYSFVINSDEKLINYLVSNVSVEIVNFEASTIKISFQDNNKYKARDIVNCIDSLYLLQTLHNKNLAQEQTLKFLDATLDSTENKLVASEVKLETFVKKHKTIDVKEDFSRIAEKIEEIENDKLKLKVKISTLSDLKEIITSNKELKSFIPTSSEVPDPQLIALITNLNNMQQDRTRLLSSQKENTFAIHSRDLAIDNLKENVLGVISQNKKILFEHLNKLNDQVIELETMFLGLPSKETEYTRLKRFYALYEKYYLLLIEKKAEYGIAKAGTVPHFVILSAADIPSKPISPNAGYVYLIGSLAALSLSFIFIFLRYFLSNNVSSIRELERLVQVPIIGGVPEYKKYKNAHSKLLINNDPKSGLSEALRSIRTNLEFINPGKSRRLVAVTSTVSGEGKTFISVNLAGIIALAGKKVVVLDMDMRKPKVHMAFEKENIKGMSTILIGQESIEACIQKSTIPNLDFISAGPIPPNPSELILLPTFDETIEELFKTYDTVIIDTPPVGLVTDGVLIMKKADIPIYVVRANYSKIGIKRTIHKLFEILNYKKLTIIINSLKPLNSYGEYSSGYGYQQGYYFNEPNTKEKFNFFNFKRIFALKEKK